VHVKKKAAAGGNPPQVNIIEGGVLGVVSEILKRIARGFVHVRATGVIRPAEGK